MIPLFSSTQVRQADKYAIETLKIPSIVLMENASLGIFQTITQKFEIDKTTDTIGIVCGPGNNGGDGFAAARHFINDGYKIKVFVIPNETELKGDAKINFEILKNLIKDSSFASVKLYTNLRDIKYLNDCNIIVDAMLGTGVKGILKEPYISIISKLNDFNAKKVAIDLPTGLDCDKAIGDLIFHADLTITLAENKKGLFFNKGYEFCGEISKGYIGIGNDFFDSLDVTEYLIEPEDAVKGIFPKNKCAHKYNSGKILIIAGSSKFVGAAIFTANSTFKVGAGAAFLAVPKSVKQLFQLKVDSAIIEDYDDQSCGYLTENNLIDLKEKIIWADVIVAGPGIGRENGTKNFIRGLLKNSDKKIILDADGIYAFTEKDLGKFDFSQTIFTPHYKEFADLLNISLETLKSDLLKYGREFVKTTSSILILKGAPTLIFTKNGDVLINSSGNPGLAKFGSGDVLSGILAGILAQNQNLELSSISSVYLHGLSADLLKAELTEHGITPTDVMNNLPKTLKFLLDSI